VEVGVRLENHVERRQLPLTLGLPEDDTARPRRLPASLPRAAEPDKSYVWDSATREMSDFSKLDEAIRKKFEKIFRDRQRELEREAKQIEEFGASIRELKSRVDRTYGFAH
jgi:hypothetical protein